MSEDWADQIAEQVLGRGFPEKGTCLILGAADTGKTALAAALCGRLAKSRAVGIVDGDVGQSHIGPPATVGWAVVKDPQVDFSQLAADGISFVGDVTPVGHLLQFTAAVMQCVKQVSRVAELVVIDTPGFIAGPAASALWWTVQRVLKPELILAVQRGDELNDILAGLQSPASRLEQIESPPQIPTKSPQQRRSYRQSRFRRYLQGSCLYDINLREVAVQASRSTSRENPVGRLVGLRDGNGTDVAVGIINDWQDGRDVAVIRAPEMDIRQIRCLIIGDVTLDLTEE